MLATAILNNVKITKNAFHRTLVSSARAKNKSIIQTKQTYFSCRISQLSLSFRFILVVVLLRELTDYSVFVVFEDLVQ